MVRCFFFSKTGKTTGTRRIMGVQLRYPLKNPLTITALSYRGVQGWSLIGSPICRKTENTGNYTGKAEIISSSMGRMVGTAKRFVFG